MGVDGVAQPLTLADPVLGYSGAWSPGGDRLLVNVFDGERLVATMLDPASGTSTELKPEGMAGELECSDWAPDARHVICTRGGPDPATDGIYTVDVASGTTKRVTTSPYHHVLGTEGDCGGGEGRAVYSGDGGRFAWVQQQCGTGADPAAEEKGAIAVASADGSNVKVIVPFGGTRTHPGGEISWSPTDDLIAFGTPEGVLSVIKADGTGLRTITLPVAGMVYGPAWSPDGKWLLVTIAGDPSFRHDLFAVAADGGSLVRLTDNREAEAFTDWAIAP
jgi:Tol biopolymer transport system component